MNKEDCQQDGLSQYDFELPKYLGVKLIGAEKMHVIEYNEKYDRDVPEDKEDGYRVVYDTGYASWSPKDVFEKAYRKIDGLTFGLAIEALKLGKKVTRSNWYGSEAGPVVMLQVPDENSKMTKPYLYMSKNNGKDVFPLDLSCESVLAEDWIIV